MALRAASAILSCPWNQKAPRVVSRWHAPASIGQGQTFLVACHALKMAYLEVIPRFDD